MMLAAGISVLPIPPVGKLPVVKWKRYQSERATEHELRYWFAQGNRIAVIAGAISGNLLILDFDQPGLLEQFAQACDDNSVVIPPECVRIQTPSGGNHLIFRSESPVAGNDKVAHALLAPPEGALWQKRGNIEYTTIDGKEFPIVETEAGKRAKKCVIETRGEGGYALTHPSARYQLMQGDFSALPVLDDHSVRALFAIAGLFDQSAEIIESRRTGACPPPQSPRKPGRPGQRPNTFTPGDDYNERGDYEGLLEAAGWRRLHRRDSLQSWTRPGKQERTCSATTGYGARLFYCFSTNAHPFEANRSYSPFGVYTMLKHDGDYSAAARQLAQEGYGDPFDDSLRPSGPKTDSPPPTPSSSTSPEAPPAVREMAEGEPHSPPLHLGEGLVGEAPPIPDPQPLPPPPAGIDHELALDWAEKYADRFRYLEGDQWFAFDKCWTYTGHEDIEKAVQEWLESIVPTRPKLKITPSRVRGVKFLAKSKVGPHRMAEFNAVPGRIPLRNGVYDIRTGDLLENSPKHLLTYQATYDYDPSAACPNWERFLQEVLIDGDAFPFQPWIDALQEWFGYCMTPDTTAQMAMLWTGAGGNGKGTATRLLTKLVGSDYTVEIPIEQLHDPYHRAELHGKLLGLVNEPDQMAMKKNANVFKAIVGNDNISARRPTEKVFNFAPLTRIIISCNELPKTNDITMGYFRRFYLVEWRYDVPAEKRDQELDDKLERELPGIFNWAMVGLKRLRTRQKKFLACDESRLLLDEYRTAEDSFKAFLEEKCELQADLWVHNETFWSAYARWCKLYNKRPQDREKVIKRLRTMEIHSSVRRVKGKPTRGWLGIALKEDIDYDQDPPTDDPQATLLTEHESRTATADDRE